MTYTVGFIGSRDEGAPIARAIADNGYPLHVVDEPAGADLPGLARISDVVGLFLDDAGNSRTLVDDGLLKAMRPGSAVVNFANGLPEEARRLAGISTPYGVTFLDVPVSGGPVAAQNRQLTAIAGGDTATVSRLGPLFASFATTVVHVGPSGCGQQAKLVSDALMAMNHQNALEVLRLAVALGVPVPGLLEVLRSGSAGSVALAAVGPVITTGNAGHFQELELDDLRLFGEAVEHLGASASPVVDRAVAGAQNLTELTALVTG
ncbi:NAD(P)-dependent oxidoreductase [Actinoplanes solisilvae]|uniref:NAD(P)-dependent oxidoreductase n=1 Tax=Actinoplanes solisilvae TaxID=2486853 RepID=UPI000FDCDB85|nr:NAD(P)-binding domain-containing protein [Actinoplanes solisilvae]